jgi:hypothetical protein
MGKESQGVKQMTVTSSNKPDIVILRQAIVIRVLNYLEQLHLCPYRVSSIFKREQIWTILPPSRATL